MRTVRRLTQRNFYPRPPRGGRPAPDGVAGTGTKFLSTPSARRATLLPSMAARARAISIHALREEGDPSKSSVPSALCDFYPRPPRGGRPFWAALPASDALISIHALREEGDLWQTLAVTASCYFYPRPPRGGRHFCRRVWRDAFRISIHALREEGDGAALAQFICVFISIHALREEGDFALSASLPHPQNFYPRPPRGGRLPSKQLCKRPKKISIHALREEGDFFHVMSFPNRSLFLSTPSARRATSVS